MTHEENRSVNVARNSATRRLTPSAGRALEMLGHAIEYLEDMHKYEGSLLVYERAQMEAIGILKRLNREIYLECPVVPSFEDRLYSAVSRLLNRLGL